MMLAPNLKTLLAMRSVFTLKPIPEPRLGINDVYDVAHCFKTLFSVLGHNPDALGIKDIHRGQK
jgi:hypothetical protein